MTALPPTPDDTAPEGTPEAARAAAPTASGPGRLLVAIYGVLAIAATARGAFQVATKLSEAPVAYLLSLFAGLVYVVATLALARGWRTLAWCAVGVELVGVLTVGTLSATVVDDFPDATVWSGFGAGYGYVPLVLPFLGLWWLRHTGRVAGAEPSSDVRP